MMMSFSGYSFCKPHSASYARVSFQAAYLKVHFPAEFMAAVISNQGGFYNTFAYVSEARRLGVTLFPPDVRESQIHWTGSGRTIRVGMMAVGSLARKTLERTVDQRNQKPFDGLSDFLDRVDPAVNEARALIHCGALDHLAQAKSRARIMWQFSQWQARRVMDKKEPTLFDRAETDIAPPDLPPDDQRILLRREFNVLGFLCHQHPMTLFTEAVSRTRTVKAASLPRCPGQRVRFAGWLITGKVVHTRGGDPMEFLTFEDETGIVETTFFPKTYDRFCHLIDRGRPYLLEGKVERNWGATTLTVDRVEPLSA